MGRQKESCMNSRLRRVSAVVSNEPYYLVLPLFQEGVGLVVTLDLKGAAVCDKCRKCSILGLFQKHKYQCGVGI